MEMLCLCFHKKRNAIDSFELIKIFDTGRPSANLDHRHKRENKEKLRQVMYMLILLHEKSSETGWDMINLVGYTVFTTVWL